MLTFQDRILQFMGFTFYAIFFITPFAMTNVNNELFEFNKMWLLFAFSIIIFFLWGLRMVSEKRFYVRRTILDIPILLFLLSQILSTIFSLDSHTSFWGYYSRFNGGLLSTITYIFLYYALVSNFFSDKEHAKNFAKRIMGISVAAGIGVALWGIPSHFGYDPTCMIFGRGLTTACWTDAFDPTVRIFSTLGQPNWLGAYLSVLLPISIAFAIKSILKSKDFSFSSFFTNKVLLLSISYLLLATLFYIALIWTNSQSSFLGLWGGIFAFAGLIKLIAFRKNGFEPRKFLRLKSLQLLGLFVIIFLLLTFLLGNPFPRFQNISLSGLQSQPQKNIEATQTVQNEASAGPALENNITGSGEIRLIVWQGALDVFKSSPLFGSGVETFAFAYYKHRPLAHNLTSEWDYLYNKAHNEYLNYLATTGILGLGTYLSFIILFLFIAIKYFYSQKSLTKSLLPASLVGAFISILISNFFGFSVVLINLYLFIIPSLFFMLTGNRSKMISFPEKSNETYRLSNFNTVQYLVLTAISAFSLFSLWFLWTAWVADKEYALGYNYNKIEEYIAANKPLEEAVKLRPGEDLFQNELSTNLASLALAFAQDNQPENAAAYAQRAKDMSYRILKRNPNNIVYLKTRTRTLYTLAQLQPELLNEAYATINKALVLAPTDAKIMYNKALIEEVTGDSKRALDTLEKTIELKPNYLDAHYRKAIVLMDLAEKSKNEEEKNKYNEEAKRALNITLQILPEFNEARELLKSLD